MRIFSSVRCLLLALIVLTMSAASLAQIGISVSFGPPALPVYEQPVCPGEGYIWTPGYWAYDNDYGDYYWVPGTWVLAPQVGFLWTPGWWGWGGEGFIFHEGYWGPRVGFYGGINYGYGYFGNGYEGGRWDHDRFFYNRSVTNVNVTNIHNVYNTTVINNNVTRVSYNGGQGGLNARPTPQQQTFDRERHMGPIAAQTQHIQAARGDQGLRASVNHGKPPIAATERPGAFNQHPVPAKEAGGPYQPPNRGGQPNHGNASAPRPGGEVPRPPTHARDITPHAQPGPPNTGNAKQDQKYQQQQQKLYAKQQQEHQKMVQKQEQDHQKMARQEQNQARQQQNQAHMQQMEQKHAQQTQQMEQRHVQQQQHMQQHQQPHNQPQPHKQGEPPKH